MFLKQKNCNCIAATISDRDTAYQSWNKSDTITVGLKNLNLVYSVKEGKLIQYINSRSKVCDLDGILLFVPIYIAKIYTIIR